MINLWVVVDEGGGDWRGRKSIIGIFLLLQNISVRIDNMKMQRGNNKRCTGGKGDNKNYIVTFNAKSCGFGKILQMF
jgi:hypothetical protein